MDLHPPFRRARLGDCRRIAELFALAGGGVPEYAWTALAADYPGLQPIEIGERCFARSDISFSYRNTVVAEIDGEVVGILLTFGIDAAPPGADDTADPVSDAEDTAEPDVMKPYRELEVPGSHYICAVSLLPEYRGRGLGSRMMEMARQEAREQGRKTLSLLAFERNTKAVRLYERLGYRVVDSQPVVPHPLIRYGGDVLLMAAAV